MASSNYNSLQVSANRRFRGGLQFGLAYTWSKVLGVVMPTRRASVPVFLAAAAQLRPLGYDRTHTLVFNYRYDLPRFGTHTGWRPVAWVLDNWQISGITSFTSSAPLTPGFSTVDGEDITGSTEGAPITVVRDLNLNKSERTFFRNFNTGAFQRPRHGNFGNVAPILCAGPASTTGT